MQQERLHLNTVPQNERWDSLLGERSVTTRDRRNPHPSLPVRPHHPHQKP
ncbi:MAG: hypothetical protein AB1589_21690 [Cyanobacteriota bacterium]